LKTYNDGYAPLLKTYKDACAMKFFELYKGPTS